MIGRERPGQQSEVATLIQQTLEQERRQRELLEQQYAHYDADDDEVMTTGCYSLERAVKDCAYINISLGILKYFQCANRIRCHPLNKRNIILC